MGFEALQTCNHSISIRTEPPERDLRTDGEERRGER